MGFRGHFFQAVHRPENNRFSMFLDTFWRGKSIEAAGRLHIPLVAGKGRGVGALCDICSRRREKNNGAEGGRSREDEEYTLCVRDRRGLVFHSGP